MILVEIFHVERVHFRSMVGRLLCGLLLAVVATVAPARAAQNELLSVHLTPPPPGGDAPAQVEIVMATEALPRHLELKRPHRFVLDLPATRARPAKSLPKSLGTLITAVRSGPQANGDLRLVFEMPAGAAVNWTPPTAPAKRFSFLVWPSAAAATATATAKATATAVATAVAASPAPTTPAVVLAPVKTEHEPAEGREVVVAIDAGHGGQDPGAIGRGGLREKDVVLDIARELAARINREPGMRAFLTRDGDYFLTLRQRIRRARDAGAQLFVSVHADSVRDPRVSGSSVYVLSLKGATDEQARMLADRENAADLAGGVSIDDKDPVIASVLVDLAQAAQIDQSTVAAERVLRSLGRVNDVRKPKVQQAGFVVLKSPDIPSMLVETAFISSPDDERLLGKPERREELAEAIFDGVRQYFVDHPPDGSRFAKERDANRQRDADRRVVATVDETGESARSGKL